MRVLFVGDVFGQPGREAAQAWLPRLKLAWQLDAIVVNGENAAQQGRGITPGAARGLFAAGADVVTLGNHAFAADGTDALMAAQPQLIRPINWQVGSKAGRGSVRLNTPKGVLHVVQVQGQVFMPKQCADPFDAMDAFVASVPLGEAILVDVHAEASSEKQALAWHLAGRVSAVVGSHTHVPTADARILASHTAFQTDAGMCGPYESVIGSSSDDAIARFRTDRGARGPLEVATGDVRLCGTLIELSGPKGAATRVRGVTLSHPWPAGAEVPAAF